MSSADKKQRAAIAALAYLQSDMVLGVGTGTTVNCFIEALLSRGPRVRAAVSSSRATSARLRAGGIEIVDLNEVDAITLYVDGADEATRRRHLIKGGGGALTGEKIVAEAAREFVCLIDDGKLVETLGAFPLPIEVISMARNSVARRLTQLGGRPVLRQGALTDSGNPILDVHGLSISNPAALESDLNQIPGVVTVGLFAHRPADVLIVGTDTGVEEI